MSSNSISLGSVEWLDYMSGDDRFINRRGKRCPIISGWGSNEVKVGPHKVDGYCQVDHVTYVFEYDGCHFHHCKLCNQTGFRQVK